MPNGARVLPSTLGLHLALTLIAIESPRAPRLTTGDWHYFGTA